ncbi:MAG TPA: S8 family serine peptidase, partial [Steroidobacteraceae bacterium]
NTITLPAAKRLRLLLNWNDPPHGADNRALSAYLLDGNSQVLSHASSQSDPNLPLDYTNMTGAAQVLRLAVTLDAGLAQGLALQVTEGSATCNIECQALAHSTTGLAGGAIGDIPDALVIGATYALSPRLLEAWSNHGPFRLDFQASGDAASPDGFDYLRLTTPVAVAKPDLVAPDCVMTPFSDGKSLTNNQFCGTSAAVPAIAGAAALLESAGFNRVQVLKALRSTAVPLGAAAWDPGYGFGLADAAAALRSGGN